MGTITLQKKNRYGTTGLHYHLVEFCLAKIGMVRYDNRLVGRHFGNKINPWIRQCQQK